MSEDKPKIVTGIQVDDLTEHALVLLLRSPRLTVSDALELLDIGDGDFRRMLKTNQKLADVIAARERGEAPLGKINRRDIRECEACGNEFVPYGGAAWCSDTCATAVRAARNRRAAPFRSQISTSESAEQPH